ncbi:MAG: septum formation initiator family protein [Endomicrobium sp.]|jgi:cell division protein FtsB|nr:septum formation initiator family protein [Endomicrobium sp.]
MKKSSLISKRIPFILIMLFLIYCFLLNSGARTIIKNLFEQKRIKAAIEKIENENYSLKKRLESLQNNKNYLVRQVKKEYKVISEDEIEYRF